MTKVPLRVGGQVYWIGVTDRKAQPGCDRRCSMPPYFTQGKVDAGLSC